MLVCLGGGKGLREGLQAIATPEDMVILKSTSWSK